MSGFSADWLSLREPADVAARSSDVTDAVLGSIAEAQPRADRETEIESVTSTIGASGSLLTPTEASASGSVSSARIAPIGVVDLGCGTGSNVRYLAPRFGPRLAASHWRLVDNDPALLAVARATVPCAVDTDVVDLRVLDDHIFDGCSLVTASALLDLVSEAWLTRLVALARRAECHVLMALNYDGRILCSPSDEDDELIRDLVNRHQRTDKGFGPALGPSAAVSADALLRAAGYTVHRAQSDWQLGPAHAELQRQLIEGWMQAATELAPELASRIQSWTTRRLAHLSAGASHLMVGHVDVGGVRGREST